MLSFLFIASPHSAFFFFICKVFHLSFFLFLFLGFSYSSPFLLSHFFICTHLIIFNHLKAHILQQPWLSGQGTDCEAKQTWASTLVLAPTSCVSLNKPISLCRSVSSSVVHIGGLEYLLASSWEQRYCVGKSLAHPKCQTSVSFTNVNIIIIFIFFFISLRNDTYFLIKSQLIFDYFTFLVFLLYPLFSPLFD